MQANISLLSKYPVAWPCLRHAAWPCLRAGRAASSALALQGSSICQGCGQSARKMVNKLIDVAGHHWLRRSLRLQLTTTGLQWHRHSLSQACIGTVTHCRKHALAPSFTVFPPLFASHNHHSSHLTTTVTPPVSPHRPLAFPSTVFARFSQPPSFIGTIRYCHCPIIVAAISMIAIVRIIVMSVAVMAQFEDRWHRASRPSRP